MRREGSRRKVSRSPSNNCAASQLAPASCALVRTPTLYAFDAAHHSDGGGLQLFLATAATGVLFRLGRPLVIGGVVVWPYPVGIWSYTSPAKTTFGLLLRRRERCISSNKESEKCTSS